MLSVIKQVSKITKHVCVGFSCGKDSLVTLDLVTKYFEKVTPFFMYLVADLSFQEKYLEYIENKYRLKIIRLPHWQLGSMLQSGVYRPHSTIANSCPVLSIQDIESYLRNLLHCQWVAYGMTQFDSIERMAMIKKNQGIDLKTRRFYPIRLFTKKTIFNYLKTHNIILPKDYKLFGRSFGRLWEDEIIAIKDKFPEDYTKIKKVFPHLESIVKRYEFSKK